MKNNDKRRKNRCYYIRLNGYDLIDFESRGLKDLHDYVELNLFTSNFTGVGDLVNYLREENFISNDYKVDEIDIVKRVKVVEDTTYYKYYSITDLPLFRDSKRFFSTPIVRRFFELNFYEYDAISYIVNVHLNILESILKRMYIEKRPLGIQVKYNQRLNNMKVLLKLINNMKDGFMNYQEEYASRLKEFYETEMLYVKDGTATINYRGLIELAKTIDEATKRFDNLVIPKIKEEPNYSKNPKKTYTSSLALEEEDPDNYMFLESDDFKNMLEEGAKQNYLDSVEDQVVDLEEKKRKF